MSVSFQPTSKFPEETGCSICQEPFMINQPLKSHQVNDTLQHIFHTECIDPWLATRGRPTCPICRVVIVLSPEELNNFRLQAPPQEVNFPEWDVDSSDEDQPLIVDLDSFDENRPFVDSDSSDEEPRWVLPPPWPQPPSLKERIITELKSMKDDAVRGAYLGVMFVVSMALIVNTIPSEYKLARFTAMPIIGASLGGMTFVAGLFKNSSGGMAGTLPFIGAICSLTALVELGGQIPAPIEKDLRTIWSIKVLVEAGILSRNTMVSCMIFGLIGRRISYFR